MCVHAKFLCACPTLCDPMDHSPPGSSVQGIFQARIFKWVAMFSSRGSSQPRDQTLISYISCIGKQVFFFFFFFLITSATWEAQSWHIYQKEELYVINSKISSSVCFYNSNKYCPINSTGENPLYYLWHCSLEAIYLTNSCEKKRNKNQRRKGKI